MTCEQFNKMLDNYENLSEQEKLAMNEHANECEKCRDELDFMLKIIMQLNTLPKIEAPNDFIDKLNKRISLEDYEEKKINRMLNSIRRNYKRYSTIAACLVLAVIVGVNGKSLMNNMMKDDDGGVIVETGTVGETDTPNTAIQAVPKSEDSTSESEVTEVPQNKAASATETQISSSATKIATANTSPTRTTSSSANTQRAVNAASVRESNISAATSESADTVKVEIPSVSVIASTAEKSTVDEPVVQSSEAVPSLARIAETDNQTDETSSDTTSGSVSKNYTIARGIYRLPDESIAQAEIAASSSSVSQEFSIDENSGMTIARGRYYIPVDDGYVNIDNNEIEVNGDDAQRAVELIQQYTDKEDDSYYVINSENISPMFEHMDREGINYQHNVDESSDDTLVSFKLVIE
jgi:hypothetical protein